MKKKKPGLFDRLFYSNKFLIVISLLLSVVLWAAVKINYSDSTTRTISDVKISIDDSAAQDNDFVSFVDQADLYVDVTVEGKAYNINSYSLTRDDIVIEATSGYIDSAGFKTLNLTAKVNESDVDVVKISPSAITVFYDREITETFNVEARLTNDIDKLSEDGYYVGQPVPSLGTVDVSGPASIVEKLTKVYFDAALSETELPLTSTKEVNADINFDLASKKDATFLKCEGIDIGTNAATITIPVSKLKTVKTSVKFVNQPKSFEKGLPNITINPAKVEISYNPEDEEYKRFNVGTIDFKQLKDTVNTFEFEVDEKLSTLLVDKSIKKFTVSVDLSSLSQTTIDASACKVVFLNQKSGYKYSASLSDFGLEDVVLIGPKRNLNKLTPDNLQIEINVSSLNTELKREQRVEITNISITSDEINDCWVSGTYYAGVTVSKKS